MPHQHYKKKPKSPNNKWNHKTHGCLRRKWGQKYSPGFFFCCCDKCHDLKEVGRKGFISPYGAQSRKPGQEPGGSRWSRNRGRILLIDWRAPRFMFSYPSCALRPTCPDITTQRGLGLHVSITSQYGAPTDIPHDWSRQLFKTRCVTLTTKLMRLDSL